jgi:hypothetical protein
MKIVEYAEKILQYQKELGHVAANMLSPGLREGHIRDLAKLYDLHFPEELVSLYQWRNGLDFRISSREVLPMGKIAFFPGYCLLSIEDAVNCYNRFKLQKEDWNADWFPIFWNSGGCVFAINCNPDSADKGKIIEYGSIYFDTDILYHSLSDMFFTLCENYRVGGFFMDVETGLSCDDDIFCMLAKDLNPDVIYWQNK